MNDWITLSPKKHAPPRLEILKACQELKIVIHQKDDLIFAEEMVSIIKSNTSHIPLLFLQPGWGSEYSQILTFEYIKHHPAWRMSMQTHKWLNIR